MQTNKPHKLTMHRASAQQALTLLTAAQKIGVNYVWSLGQPFSESSTHLIDVELSATLDSARTMLTSAAKEVNFPGEWQLLPWKI